MNLQSWSRAIALTVGLGSLAAIGCGQPDPDPDPDLAACELPCGTEEACFDGRCMAVTVIDAMRNDGELETALYFINIAAGRADDLRNQSSVTMFASEESVFRDTSEDCLTSLSRSALQFGRRQTVVGQVRLTRPLLEERADAGRNALPMEGQQSVTLFREGEHLYVDGARVTRTIEAVNGVVHVLADGLLAPEPASEACLPAP